MGVFAYDINDPRQVSNDAMKLRKDSQTISDYCASIIYVCNQIADNWQGEDGTYFVTRLKERADAIKSFSIDGIHLMAEALELYGDSMVEITSKRAK